MKISVRQGVFETNSSSTHSICICSGDEYDAWKRGETLMSYGGTFYTRDEAISKMLQSNWFRDKDIDLNDKELVDQYLRDDEFYTYDNYFESEYLETFDTTYTTKSGEKVIAFGKYGYDG